ncbi:hypothetical protein EVAR_32570_1 [Eumeta japonica]|uniref:Uncharacterized protein n=1 Tax=Eumeta variegata TaxID=151549 RepID=A0A4C1VRW8_EUMVA|nr:hypothetical protein EVAR_32570_1 [Eumeta japonica]
MVDETIKLCDSMLNKSARTDTLRIFINFNSAKKIRKYFKVRIARGPHNKPDEQCSLHKCAARRPLYVVTVGTRLRKRGGKRGGPRCTATSSESRWTRSSAAA